MGLILVVSEFAKTFKSHHPVGSNDRFIDFLSGATDAAFHAQLATDHNHGAWKPSVSLVGPLKGSNWDLKAAMRSLRALLNSLVDSIVSAQASVGLSQQMAATIGQMVNLSKMQITIVVVSCAICVMVAVTIGRTGYAWIKKIIKTIKIQLSAGATFQLEAEHRVTIDTLRETLNAVAVKLEGAERERGSAERELQSAKDKNNKSKETILSMRSRQFAQGFRLLQAQRHYLELLIKTTELRNLQATYDVELKDANRSIAFIKTCLGQLTQTDDRHVVCFHKALQVETEARKNIECLRQSVTDALNADQQKFELAVEQVCQEAGPANKQVFQLLDQRTAQLSNELDRKISVAQNSWATAVPEAFDPEASRATAVP